MGIELPPPEEALPEDVEVKLSRLVAEAGKKVLEKSKSDAAQRKAKKAEEDPIIQMQKRELAIKEGEAKAKAANDAGKLAMEGKKLENDLQIAKLRANSQERQTGAKIGVQAVSEKEKIASSERIEGAKMGIDVVEALRDEDAADRREGAKMGVDIAKEAAKDKRERAIAKDAARNRGNTSPSE